MPREAGAVRKPAIHHGQVCCRSLASRIFYARRFNCRPRGGTNLRQCGDRRLQPRPVAVDIDTERQPRVAMAHQRLDAFWIDSGHPAKARAERVAQGVEIQDASGSIALVYFPTLGFLTRLTPMFCCLGQRTLKPQACAWPV